MKKGFTILLGLLFCLFFLTPAYAQEKIGYVDVAKLFDEYNKTKEYDKGLESKAKAYELEKNAKVLEIKQLQDKLNLLADKEKEAKEKELEEKLKAARDFTMAKEGDLRKERDDHAKEVLDDIQKAVEQFAKKEGFSMIFNDRVLIYTNKANDVTDKVLGILQVGYPKK